MSASITVRVPLAIRRRPGRRTVVMPGGEQWRPTRADPAMVKALGRAFRWRRLLEEGRYDSISAIAAAERLDRGYVGTVLRLTLLAPEIVEAVLNGRSGELGLARLLEPWPVEWGAQISTSGIVGGDWVAGTFSNMGKVAFAQSQVTG